MNAIDSWGRETALKPPHAGVAEQIEAMQTRLVKLERELSAMRPRRPVPISPRYLWIGRIAETIADQWEVPVAAVLGNSRTSPLIRPRFVHAWVVHHVAQLSYPATARLVGYLDHTSVMHALRRVEEWRVAEPGFAHETDLLLIVAKRMCAEALQHMRSGSEQPEVEA